MTREVDLSAFLYVALDGHPIGLVGEMKHLLFTRHSGASQFVVHAEDILPFCDLLLHVVNHVNGLLGALAVEVGGDGAIEGTRYLQLSLFVSIRNLDA